MSIIVAGQDVPAADLPEVEPSAADLDLVDLDELHALDVAQERMDAELTELARFGARAGAAALRRPARRALPRSRPR